MAKPKAILCVLVNDFLLQEPTDPHTKATWVQKQLMFVTYPRLQYLRYFAIRNMTNPVVFFILFILRCTYPIIA